MANYAKTKYYEIHNLPPGIQRLPASRIKRLQEIGKVFDGKTGEIRDAGTQGHPIIFDEWEPVYTPTGKYKGVATL